MTAEREEAKAAQGGRNHKFFGSTTNRVRSWENSVFSFQFSVFWVAPLSVAYARDAVALRMV